MPIYEYECLTCGTTFEKRQSFSAEPVSDCPNGHGETRRLLSTPAIVFKGSGFYETDYKKKSPSAKEAGKTEQKTEKKAATASAKAGTADKGSGSAEKKGEAKAD